MKKLPAGLKISCFIGIIFCLISGGCGKAITTQTTSMKATSATTTLVTTTSGSKNLAGKIAFASKDENGNLEIYVMNADGTNLKKLTDNSIGAQYPVWSPDGKMRWTPLLGQ